MKRGAYVIFSIVLVLACCFFTGCTSSPSDPASQGKAHTGASFDRSSDEIHTNYSFQEVMTYIYAVPLNPVTNEPVSPAEMHFLSISGDNLDGVGNASSWTFVVQYQNNTKFVIYDKFGESVTSWAREYSAEEIFPDKVVSPSKLLDQNRADIFKTPQAASTESRKLALSGGNYTLVIKGQNSTRILTFDATTGALTSSNER